jgi:hypothetical protein
MQQGMLLCLHSWGEEESLRARHKTVLFTKMVSFCFLLCDVKGLCQPNTKKTLLLRPTLHYESRPIMFNSNQAFPIGAKVEISLMGFYTRSRG